VTARNIKDVNVVRQLALGRIETLLSSLTEISAEKTLYAPHSKKGLRKVLINAVVTVDAEDKNP